MPAIMRIALAFLEAIIRSIKKQKAHRMIGGFNLTKQLELAPLFAVVCDRPQGEVRTEQNVQDFPLRNMRATSSL